MLINRHWNLWILVISLAGSLAFTARSTPVPAGNDQKNDSISDDEKPLSVAIVVETSSRVEPLLPAIRRTGIVFTQAVLGPEGEAAVIGYNDEVDRLLDFTSDDDAIEKAVQNIKSCTSGMHLYDALAQAEVLLSDRSPSRRHVIVVLAEATDRGSEESLKQVIHKAQLEDVAIYSVALSSTAAKIHTPDGEASAPRSITPPGIFSLPPMPGTPQTPTTEALREGNINLRPLAMWGAKQVRAPLRDNPIKIAAAATGGLYQSTFRERSIEPAIDRIADELHAD